MNWIQIPNCYLLFTVQIALSDDPHATKNQGLSVFLQIPEEMSRCRNSYVEQALLPRRLEELSGCDAGLGGYRSYLRDGLDALLKEAKDKFKGYDSFSTPEQAELAYRKVNSSPQTLCAWTHKYVPRGGWTQPLETIDKRAFKKGSAVRQHVSWVWTGRRSLFSAVSVSCPAFLSVLFL